MSAPEVIEITATILASVTRRVPRSELSRHVPDLLGKVWAFLKTAPLQKAGHNVCIYRHGNSDSIELEAGVQVASEFQSQGTVVCSRTPSGRAAHVVHIGPYHELGKAHDALIQFCEALGCPVGVHWEVYGDWNDDPSQLRTDVYRTIG
jgi:effector-binding domain-containing protein